MTGPPAVDHTFTAQGVAVLVSLLVATLTIIGTFRKWRRESEADARSRTDELKTEFRLHDTSTDERLTKVETRIADFMPRSEIEAKIEHEKGNRVMADNALKDRSDRHDRDISDIKVAVGRLDQKQDGMSGELHEMKQLIKDFSRDLNAKLDKQSECLNQIARKTP